MTVLAAKYVHSVC